MPLRHLVGVDAYAVVDACRRSCSDVAPRHAEGIGHDNNDIGSLRRRGGKSARSIAGTTTGPE
jgi:hypothetical protein